MARTSTTMKKVRDDRIHKCEVGETKRLAEESRRERLEKEYPEMRKVVDFFYDNCPVEVPDRNKQKIEALFDGRTSRSKLGLIMYIASIIGYDWPEWVSMAKKEFGINY